MMAGGQDPRWTTARSPRGSRGVCDPKGAVTVFVCLNTPALFPVWENRYWCGHHRTNSTMH